MMHADAAKRPTMDGVIDEFTRLVGTQPAKKLKSRLEGPRFQISDISRALTKILPS